MALFGLLCLGGFKIYEFAHEAWSEGSGPAWVECYAGNTKVYEGMTRNGATRHGDSIRLVEYGKAGLNVTLDGASVCVSKSMPETPPPGCSYSKSSLTPGLPVLTCP